MKRGQIIYFFTLISILLLLIPFASAQVEEGERSSPDFFDEGNNQATIPATGEGTANNLKDAEVKFPDGKTGTATGTLKANDGHINVDTYTGNELGEKVEGAENLYYQGDAVYIDRAKYFECSGVKAINSQNIYCSPSKVKIGSAETIQKYGATGSDVKNVNTGSNTFSVDSAKVIYADNNFFGDIKNSTFVVDDQNKLVDVSVTSAIDNNTFDLKDTAIVLDNGEAFHAVIDNGNLTIDTSNPISITKDAETIVTLTNIIDPARKILNESDSVEPQVWESGNITTKQIGSSSVEIDSVLGVIAVHLAPTSRYISYTNNSAMQPFSLYAVPFHSYDFYLKKQANQTMPIINECYHCGIVDFTKNTVVLHGYIDYERLGTNGKFVKIAEGRADNSAITLALDKNMDKITDVYISGARAHLYSGPFEVMTKSGTFYYNYHEFVGVPLAA